MDPVVGTIDGAVEGLSIRILEGKAVGALLGELDGITVFISLRWIYLEALMLSY